MSDKKIIKDKKLSKPKSKHLKIDNGIVEVIVSQNSIKQNSVSITNPNELNLTPQAEQGFKFDVMNKIHQVKPISRLFAQFRSTLLILTLILIGFIITIALAIFGYDLQEKIAIFEFTNNPILENIFSFLFELLLIIPIGVALMYYIYRHTDWKFVKERFAIVVVSSLLITVLSSGLVVYLKNIEENNLIKQNFNSLKQNIKNKLPFRKNIEQSDQKELSDLGYYFGIIVRMENDNIIVMKNNSQETKTFVIKETLNKQTLNIKINQKVILSYEDEDGILVVQKIQVVK